MDWLKKKMIAQKNLKHGLKRACDVLKLSGMQTQMQLSDGDHPSFGIKMLKAKNGSMSLI